MATDPSPRTTPPLETHLDGKASPSPPPEPDSTGSTVGVYDRPERTTSPVAWGIGVLVFLLLIVAVMAFVLDWF